MFIRPKYGDNLENKVMYFNFPNDLFDYQSDGTVEISFNNGVSVTTIGTINDNDEYIYSIIANNPFTNIETVLFRRNQTTKVTLTNRTTFRFGHDSGMFINGLSLNGRSGECVYLDDGGSGDPIKNMRIIPSSFRNIQVGDDLSGKYVYLDMSGLTKYILTNFPKHPENGEIISNNIITTNSSQEYCITEKWRGTSGGEEYWLQIMQDNGMSALRVLYREDSTKTIPLDYMPVCILPSPFVVTGIDSTSPIYKYLYMCTDTMAMSEYNGINFAGQPFTLFGVADMKINGKKVISAMLNGDILMLGKNLRPLESLDIIGDKKLFLTINPDDIKPLYSSYMPNTIVQTSKDYQIAEGSLMEPHFPAGAENPDYFDWSYSIYYSRVNPNVPRVDVISFTARCTTPDNGQTWVETPYTRTYSVKNTSILMPYDAGVVTLCSQKDKTVFSVNNECVWKATPTLSNLYVGLKLGNVTLYNNIPDNFTMSASDLEDYNKSTLLEAGEYGMLSISAFAYDTTFSISLSFGMGGQIMFQRSSNKVVRNNYVTNFLGAAGSTDGNPAITTLRTTTCPYAQYVKYVSDWGF